MGALVMRFFRLYSTLLVLAFAVLANPAHAGDQTSAAGQIADLERLVAQYEAAFPAGKTDPAKEMPYLLAMAKLATLYAQADRLPDTAPLNEKILARVEKIFGPENPSIVSQIEALASTYGLLGRLAEAETLRKRAIAINERAFGADSLNVAVSLQGMASLFRLQERPDEALAFATRALAIASRRLSPGDPQRAIFLAQVADIHMSGKRYDKAEPLLKQALGIVENAKGVDPKVARLQTLQYLQSLGVSYLMQGRHAEAQPVIDRAIATSTQLFGPGHTVTGAMLMTLGLQLLDQGRLDEAERLYREALPINETPGKVRAALADNYVGLGLVAFKRKNWREAATLSASCRSRVSII